MRETYETEISGAKRVIADIEHQIGTVGQQRVTLHQEMDRITLEREKISRYTSDDRARIEELNHAISKNEAVTERQSSSVAAAHGRFLSI